MKLNLVNKRSGITLSLGLGGVFATLLLLTWGRYGDPFLDYGITLYGPFVTSRGFVPFRDFEWLYGPFSVVVNGLVFRCFGPHNLTLLTENAILLAIFSWLLHRLFHRWFGIAGATAALVTFWLCFAFSHSTKVGTYNYLAPYSSETLHGLYLGLLAVALGERVVLNPSWTILILHSLIVAAAILTKAEMAVAAMFAWGATYAVGAASSRQPKVWAKRFALSCLLFFGFVAGVFVVASTVMAPQQALNFVGGAWRMLGTDAATVKWNKETMGFDAPLQNAFRLFASTLAAFAAILIILAISKAVELLPGSKQWKVALSVALFLIGVTAFSRLAVWEFLARSLPVVMLLLAVAHFVALQRGNGTAEEDVGRTLWLAWALGALLRMLLNARIRQYGFVQAMPATVFLAGWAVGQAPEWARRYRLHTPALFAAIISLLVALNFTYARESFKYLSRKTEWWETPMVRMRVYGSAIDPRIPLLREAVEYLRQTVSPQTKFLAIPEGAFVAFCLGQPMATRTPQLTPTEVAGFGESRIVYDFETQRPDVLVIIHKHTVPTLFGQSPDYGQQIMQWVKAHYRRERLFGDEPHQSHEKFGIEVLRRAEPQVKEN